MVGSQFQLVYLVAARRMDKSIRSALAGHKVDELEL